MSDYKGGTPIMATPEKSVNPAPRKTLKLRTPVDVKIPGGDLTLIRRAFPALFADGVALPVGAVGPIADAMGWSRTRARTALKPY